MAVSISSATIDKLIRYETKDPWHKSGTRYVCPASSLEPWRAGSKYDIYIETDGPVPVLVIKEKQRYDLRGRPIGRRRSLGSAEITDLTPFPGSGWERGRPQFWVASLLDKATGGAIPQHDTILATMEEAKRQGWYVEAEHD